MKLPVQQYPYASSSRPLDQASDEPNGYQYSYSEPMQEKHLRDYWNVLVKRLRYMVPIFLGTIALGLLYSLFSPTLYTASSVLQIEPQNPTVTGVGGVVQTDPEGGGPYDYYQTQYALLKSGPLAARVIKNLDLQSNPAFKSSTNIFNRTYNWIIGSIVGAVDSVGRAVRGESAPGDRGTTTTYELGVPPYLVGRYLKFLTVTPVRNTRLVNISFETPDPKLSQSLANGHATGFIQMILENRFNLTQEARNFLSKKLAELRQAVQKAENELNLFRKEHGFISLEKGENIVVERLVDINKELTKASAERIQAESLYQMTRNKNTEYLAQVLNNGLIQQLKSNLAGLEAERARLSSIFTREHPRMQELSQQLAETQRALKNEIATVVRGIESSYAAARAREEALEAEAKKQQQTALGLKQVSVDYAVLNEEVVVNRGLYEAVLKRLNETSVGNDLAAANIQIMQRAEMPLYPSSPNTFRNLLIATFLGLIFAVGTALFLEYMDTSITTPQQVWDSVALGTLGVVPHLGSLQKRHLFPSPTRLIESRLFDGTKKTKLERAKKSKDVPRELVMAKDHLSIVAESYRTIRTALMASRPESPPRSIVLTSPCPDDGKTITTLNLAMSLAQSGKRVIVVDADLRRGRCHRLMNVAHNVGLVDVITGQQYLNTCIQSTAVRNLSLLSRGTLPPNPGDLLTSQRMRDVLRELTGSFDFVLLDSPPVIAVSDAAVLSTICDGVLLVLHGQQTTRHAARRAAEQLDAVRAPMIGVVLNGVDIRDPEYVDYRSYYPGYFAAASEEFDNVDDNRSGVNGAVSGPSDRPQADAAKTALVPREFMDQIIVQLNDALGAESSSIVRNQVAALRESIDAFPMYRLWELVQLVSQEIWEHQRKVKFLRAMSTEIRQLHV